MDKNTRPTKVSLEELQALWQTLASTSYTLGSTTVTCHLCQAHVEVDTSEVYAVILQTESTTYGLIKELALVQAENLYTLFTQKKVSLCHVSEIIEDMACDHVRNLWTTF